MVWHEPHTLLLPRVETFQGLPLIQYNVLVVVVKSWTLLTMVARVAVGNSMAAPASIPMVRIFLILIRIFTN
jgi:hypothetical protein